MSGKRVRLLAESTPGWCCEPADPASQPQCSPSVCQAAVDPRGLDRVLFSPGSHFSPTDQVIKNDNNDDYCDDNQRHHNETTVNITNRQLSNAKRIYCQ